MTTPFKGNPSLSSRLQDSFYMFESLSRATAAGLRVALPGIVKSFNSEQQTVEVDLAIQDRIKANMPALPGYNASTGDIQIPTLLDVPIVIPRAGGFSLTFPIKPGDECLVIIGDMCINSWWQNGASIGQGQIQESLRRHDLSDAFAILGPWSQPRVLPDYSITSAQLRTDDGTVIINISEGGVTITAPTVTVANGGAAQSLVTNAFYQWFVTEILPILQAPAYTPYVGSLPPTNSETTVLLSE